MTFFPAPFLIRFGILAILTAWFLGARVEGVMETGENRIVRFLGNGGEEFDLELFGAKAPLTVRNFLNYVESGRYNATIIHRSVPGFVIQGGGFVLKGNTIESVKTDAAVRNEPGISNLRGTVAMAKLGNDPNSATSQWFINLVDNSAILDGQNGGFTVFGRVLGNGMAVADRIAGYSRYNATEFLGGAFGELPLRAPDLTRENLVLFESARVLAEGTLAMDFDFSKSAQGFTGGFADLPTNFDAALYELVADHRALPSGLGGEKALYLSGANRSADLWMFWKKQLTGLKPNTAYEVVLDLEMASNVPAGLAGIGGAPGESVFVKAGASAVEPVAAADAQGWLRWNVDKGNQSAGGAAATVLGNIAKEGDSTNNYARISRTNRSAKLVASTAADGSLWIFFGTDSGFEGATSVYFTRATAVLAPFPPVNLSSVAGDFVGNFEGPSAQGQVALKIGKAGAFTGTVVTAAGRSAIRGKFSRSGSASVPVSLLSGSLELLLKTRGLEDGRWDAADEVYLEAIFSSSGSAEMPFELRPAPRKSGPAAPLVGKTINTLLESRNESENGFGFGFAGVKPGKNGVFRFAGALADGTRLTGSARAVEDGAGGWKLPVAMPLASVKGFLHGEAAIDSNPADAGFHLASETPWTWTRPANPRAKAFQLGFEEKLTMRGREWNWTRGASALGGPSANFTMILSFGDNSGGFVPAAGVDGISGTLGANNKPVWSAIPPKGFAMTITPATGLVRGRIPGVLNGKAVTVSYQGMVFLSDMPLESGVTARGAGFGTVPGGVLGDIRILSP
jgi:cyclophilin family peptidyl-prolyl cis-trans isomerase